MDQALNSQKTPHTSPLRASYGMSFVSILMKNDRVIKGFYCTIRTVLDPLCGLAEIRQEQIIHGYWLAWMVTIYVCANIIKESYRCWYCTRKTEWLAIWIHTNTRFNGRMDLSNFFQISRIRLVTNYRKSRHICDKYRNKIQCKYRFE